MFNHRSLSSGIKVGDVFFNYTDPSNYDEDYWTMVDFRYITNIVDGSGGFFKASENQQYNKVEYEPIQVEYICVGEINTDLENDQNAYLIPNLEDSSFKVYKGLVYYSDKDGMELCDEDMYETYFLYEKHTKIPAIKSRWRR